MFTQHFERDFFAILEAQEPFAFVRFGDGEYAILDDLDYKAASGWSCVPGACWFKDELAEVLRASMPRFCLGLASPCCMGRAAAYLRSRTLAETRQLTFSTLFSMRNFRRVPRLVAKFRGAALVGCKNADFEIPAGGVTKKWDVDDLVDKLLEVDRPILVAGGPCANIIIYRYWQRAEPAKRQTILDVGAAWDKQIHGEVQRYYNVQNSPLLYHECSWTSWESFSMPTKRRRKRAKRKAKLQAAYAQAAKAKTRFGYLGIGRPRRPGSTCRVKK